MTGEPLPPPPPPPPPAPPPMGVVFGVDGFLETEGPDGFVGSAGLGLSGRCGLLPARLGGGGAPPLLPCRPTEPNEGAGPSLAAGTGGEGGLRVAAAPPPGDDREGPLPLREPRWGRGGPSRTCPGDDGRLGVVVRGDVTLLGRGGACMSLSPLLCERVMAGGRRSCCRWNEGDPCLPLDAEEEGVCWGTTGGRGAPSSEGSGAGALRGPMEMLSSLDGESSPRNAASTAVINNSAFKSDDPLPTPWP